MSRTVYLIRHAMPTIPLGERWCVGGRTDLPLSRLGRIQAARLPFVPELRSVTAVFCSSLQRARETALPLSPRPLVVPGLEEQDMGVWDGLSFREIQRRWPELYEARERDPDLWPEGAETTDAVSARMGAAVSRCLRESEGDIAIVSHKSAIASLVGNRERLGYTSLSVLEEVDGSLIPGTVGLPPMPPADDALCLALLRASGADDMLIGHSRAVAELADQLCAALREKGLALNSELIHLGALLHDLAKGEADHAALGGLWLRELGYWQLANVVRQHTEPDSALLNEAGLVFLADKAVQGTERISIESRFEKSLAKCPTEEAKAAHARRLALTKALQREVNRLCEAVVIA